MSINKLSRVNTIVAGDLIPIGSGGLGGDAVASVETLTDYVADKVNTASGIPNDSSVTAAKLSADVATLIASKATPDQVTAAITAAIDGLPDTGGSTVTPVDFTVTGDFTANRRMPKTGFQAQTGAYAFNFGTTGAVEDTDTSIFITSNGSSITAPGFIGADALSSINSGDQVVISLAYSGGLKICTLRVLSAATTTPGDTTPPTVNSRSVANGTPTVINLTFTEAMDMSSVPATGAFAVSGKTVTNFVFVDSTHANVTVSVAFANGVSATLGYTQPGTGNLKDAAGNLLASFTGAVIVNNVAAPGDTTAPTVTTRAVQNGTPSVLNLTFSEAMNTAASPATSAFTVDGHSVTAFAWVDTTHANLTLGTAFVNGEAARNLAYSVPGSSPLEDAVGNDLAAFTGAAIVNNVQATAGPTVSDNFNRADSSTSAGPLWTAFNGAVLGIESNKVKIFSEKTTGVTGGITTPTSSGNGTLTDTITLGDYTTGQGNILRLVDGNNFLFTLIGNGLTALRAVNSGSSFSIKSASNTLASGAVVTGVQTILNGSTITVKVPGQADFVVTASDFAAASDGVTVGADALVSGVKHGISDKVINDGRHQNWSFVPA
jgi:hypothetical protein